MQEPQFKDRLSHIEELLEDFKHQKVNIKRQFISEQSTSSADNNSVGAGSTTLTDVVGWLQTDPASLPAWKEHLIQLYVKNTVDSYFTGMNKRTTSDPVKTSKDSIIVEDKMNKKSVRPVKQEIRQSRIIRGKVERFEPFVEKKKKIDNHKGPTRNPVTMNVKDKVEVPKTNNHNKDKTLSKSNPPKNNLKKKLPPGPKRNIVEESKEDKLWKDIFSRNNFNVDEIREFNKLHKTPMKDGSKAQDDPEVLSMRPISPLIAPNVSITPRKLPMIGHTKDLSPTKIPQFNIDKFLSQLKDIQTQQHPPVSPVPSEALTSFTYPIPDLLSCYDSEEDYKDFNTPENRYQDIKYTLLDPETPPPTSANSTICRVLDNCFDSYDQGNCKDFVYPYGPHYSPSLDSYLCPSSSTTTEPSNPYRDVYKRTPMMDKTCQTEAVYISPREMDPSSLTSWSPSPLSSRSGSNKKDLQRSQLESNPKFKRVIDDIRRESEELLKRTSYIKDPEYQSNNSARPRKLEFGQETSYKPTCCSSLSTGLSEMCLGSDFTEANSVLYPSSSNWDSM